MVCYCPFYCLLCYFRLLQSLQIGTKTDTVDTVLKEEEEEEEEGIYEGYLDLEVSTAYC